MHVDVIATDPAIEHSLEPAEVRRVIERALGNICQRILRVEVNLSLADTDADGAERQRCAMEIRLRGHQPIGVSHLAPTADGAFSGAAATLTQLIGHALAEYR